MKKRKKKPPQFSGLSESHAPVVASVLSGWLVLDVASQLAHPRSCQCSLGQRDFEVGRHRVSSRVRLVQLHLDVLVALAVGIDVVAIILLNGQQLPLGVSSKHLIDSNIGVSLFVPLVLWVDVIDVFRYMSFVLSP